jgi:hypothetical protein
MAKKSLGQHQGGWERLRMVNEKGLAIGEAL